MTFQARFKIQDVSDGPRPIDVLAVASVDGGDGTAHPYEGVLSQNTELAKSMRLEIVLDTDETSLKVGDEIVVNGHFVGGPATT